MHLSESLKKQYTSEPYSAREAQSRAERIAFGPIVFEVARIALKWGILELLRDEPLTIPEVAKRTGRPEYAVKVLLEASLTIGIVLVNPDNDKFELSKTGWFLINDPATRVNIDFNHDVNYEGMFHLEEALATGKPAGLRHFGPWPTVYEGLSQLPADVQKSWFAFDHFYSDSAFDSALPFVFRSKPRRLLDVGGNTGRFALRCVGTDPDVRVTIVDLPQQLEMMRRQTAGKPGADRIDGWGMNVLADDAAFPEDVHWDALWMSQFLDCFAPSQIVAILKKAVRVMDENSTLFIMENLWDRQKYEPEAFCLTQISLYFSCIANGNSKMYHSEDLFALIAEAGLRVEEVHDNLGQGHSLVCCKLAEHHG